MFDLRSVLTPGADAVVEKILDESDTAAYYGTGTLGRLIATPAYVAMMIKAAVNAIEDRLPIGFVSVGRSLELSHDAPTCYGMTLRVKATLEDIKDDRLIFDIVACDNHGVVGHGKHVRTVVSREHLIERAHKRCMG
jgi:fluoroacetyl-CoA thioesterase